MPTWRVLTTIMPGGPTPAVDLLLPTQVAARARAAIERARPGVTQTSVHFCPHAVGGPSSEWWNCKNDSRAQYEEM